MSLLGHAAPIKNKEIKDAFEAHGFKIREWNFQPDWSGALMWNLMRRKIELAKPSLKTGVQKKSKIKIQIIE